MRERGASWRVLGVLPEYSPSVNGYPKPKPWSTLGASVLFCVFGYRFGYWGTPVGPTPITPGPAVHRNGWTALHSAAARGNRRMIRSLVGFGADLNAQTDDGCAVCARGESAQCVRPGRAVREKGLFQFTIDLTMIGLGHVD